MGEPTGFISWRRETPTRRPIPVRVADWREVYEPFDEASLRRQAGRCMDCGIPFCNQGCPLGNLVPDWNDLVYRGGWRAAIERLHATNNFPEFTGRLCPAPCESSCVLGINADPVTIKQVELEIVERAWAEGWITPLPAATRTGHSIGVIGSGPAGLAAAQQLTRAGHEVTVYERADRAGGLLRYGIPEFKMEKRHLERRLAQMRAEGTQFVTGVEVGREMSVGALRARHDAIVVAVGATAWRDLPVPGRELAGIHQAMEYLPEANRACEGDDVPRETARGRHVVIIGGGDTGADCLGTVHREGAASVAQLEILSRPPDRRAEENPWPQWAAVYRTSSAHEEGGERVYSVRTRRFLDDGAGRVRGLEVEEVRAGAGGLEAVPDSVREIPADMVLLAMGFVGPARTAWLEELGIGWDARGAIARDERFVAAPDVYVAGDAGRGQSLIVWAIAEGRAVAAEVDRRLTGRAVLPSPIVASTAPAFPRVT